MKKKFQKCLHIVTRSTCMKFDLTTPLSPGSVLRKYISAKNFFLELRYQHVSYRCTYTYFTKSLWRSSLLNLLKRSIFFLDGKENRTHLTNNLSLLLSNTNTFFAWLVLVTIWELYWVTDLDECNCCHKLCETNPLLSSSGILNQVYYTRHVNVVGGFLCREKSEVCCVGH